MRIDKALHFIAYLSENINPNSLRKLCFFYDCSFFTIINLIQSKLNFPHTDRLDGSATLIIKKKEERKIKSLQSIIQRVNSHCIWMTSFQDKISGVIKKIKSKKTVKKIFCIINSKCCHRLLEITHRAAWSPWAMISDPCTNTSTNCT